jgi:hypothetical protein
VTRDGRWRVVPAESFVGYRVREKLTFLPAPSDAVGRTSVIVGTTDVRGHSFIAIRVSADARTLKSDQSRRDGAVRHLLERGPVVSFVLASPVTSPDVPNGRIFSLRAPGTLTLNGVARKVVFPVQARWTAIRLEVIGTLQVKFADYGIRRPQFGPVISVSNFAKIEVQLSFARA